MKKEGYQVTCFMVVHSVVLNADIHTMMKVSGSRCLRLLFLISVLVNVLFILLLISTELNDDTQPGHTKTVIPWFNSGGLQQTDAIPLKYIFSDGTRVTSPLRDYVLFPCLTDQRDGHCVRTVNTSLMSKHVAEYECVKLRVLNNLNVCIHDPRTDRYISGAIFAGRIWEHFFVKNITHLLTSDPHMAFLDIGSNIGMYSLAAARVCNRVVAVDANPDNIRLLAKSIELERLESNLTVIWNGLSENYRSVSLTKNRGFNIGTISLDLNRSLSAVNDSYHVNTIRLNDLKYLFNNRKVGIKMDVEDHELHVLTGARSFLRDVDVRFIQMEFLFHRRKDSGNKIVQLLKEFQFKPFKDCAGKESIESNAMKYCPENVCFVKINNF